MSLSEGSSIGEEVYSYVCRNSRGGPPIVLGLYELGVLIEELKLDYADLSPCLLVYYFLRGTTPILKHSIPKAKFSAGVKDAVQWSEKPNAANKYAPVFTMLRRKVDTIDKSLREDPKALADFYNFLYGWLMGSSDLDDADRPSIAKELWEMFFFVSAPRPKTYTDYMQFSHLRDWLDFLDTEEFRKEHHISKDLWQQILPFSKVNSYETYDPEDSWPSAFDRFVEWLRKRGKGAANGCPTSS